MPVKTYKAIYDSRENIYKYVLIDVKTNDNLTLSLDILYENENKTKNKKIVKEIFKQWIKKFLIKQKSLEVNILNNIIKDELIDDINDLKTLFKNLNLQKFYILITGVFALHKYKVPFHKLVENLNYETIEQFIDDNLFIDEFLNDNDFNIEKKINFTYFLKEILNTLYGEKVASCIISFKNNHISDKMNFNKNIYIYANRKFTKHTDIL